MKKVKCTKGVPGFEKFFKIGESYEIMGETNLFFRIKISDDTVVWIDKDFFEGAKENPNQNTEVLKLEYDKAFDVWYGRVSYQNEEVLKRMGFEDKGIGVAAKYMPRFEKETKTLYVKGIHVAGDNIVFEIGTDEDKKIVEEIVKLTNDKYGVKRKTWKKMLEECKEVPFDPKQDNWSVYYNHKTEEVDAGYSTHIEEYNKYISKEDAYKIVIECLENQRKPELLKAWKEELEKNLKVDKKC